MSDMSLDQKLDKVKKTLKHITKLKFKDESELSQRVISKLPCIKSCNKTTFLEEFESIKEPQRKESQESDKKGIASFYVKLPNPPD